MKKRIFIFGMVAGWFLSMFPVNAASEVVLEDEGLIGEETFRTEGEEIGEATHRTEGEEIGEATHRTEGEEIGEATHRTEGEEIGEATHRTEEEQKDNTMLFVVCGLVAAVAVVTGGLLVWLKKKKK